MPANLTPEYRKAEQAYREARTEEERLACLERMLAVIPKHKGTDHMQADLKRRIAKLRHAPGAKAGSRQRDIFHVERGGAGQGVLMGLPNCGKSALVGALSDRPHGLADGLAERGKTFRTEEYEDDHQDDDQLGHTETER